MFSISLSTLILFSTSTPFRPLRYFLSIGPATGCLKSFSEGNVTTNPPAMSCASLLISYGNLVTLCLQTWASISSLRYTPDFILCARYDDAIPAAKIVSLR